MPDQHAQTQISEAGGPKSSPGDIHPIIAALEKADTAAVVLSGFLGTSKGPEVRLYEAMDTSSYLEIPKEAIIHLEMDKDGGPGAVQAFVRASHEIMAVRRVRITAGNYQQAPPTKEFPRPRQCHDFCEDSFKPKVTAYFIKLTQALREINPARQDQLLAQAGEIITEAKRALYNCLTECAQTHRGQYYFGIDGLYAQILERNGVPPRE